MTVAAIPVYREGHLWYWADGTTGKRISLPSDQADISIAEMLHQSADADESLGICYFIGGRIGAIKIGFSVDPIGRLSVIQACSPIAIRILATRTGGQDREAAYHCQFADHRLHGEWFDRHPDILAEIDRLNPSPSKGLGGVL